MSEQTKRALINIEYEVYKPFVHAGVLACGCAAFAIPAGEPALSWACLGAGFSFVWYWGSNNLGRIKRPKGNLPRSGAGHVNSASGSRKVRTFEYQPRYITRETYPQAIWRKVVGNPQPRQQKPAMTRPHILKDAIFRSAYEGRMVELLETDVRRFLASAWRNRARGSGLGQRRWVREWRRRPQWYQDVGPNWYYAFLALLRDAQLITHRQLVVVMGYQQYGLKFDPHTTLALLKWAETQK